MMNYTQNNRIQRYYTGFGVELAEPESSICNNLMNIQILRYLTGILPARATAAEEIAHNRDPA
jgi:hypothetical protein